MKRKITTCVVLALLVTTAGCGYFKSGTWEDDPKNWKRAFRSAKPPDVVVTHSLYWRSPHWSYEFQYFFEIEPNTELREQLFRATRRCLADAESGRTIDTAELRERLRAWRLDRDKC